MDVLTAVQLYDGTRKTPVVGVIDLVFVGGRMLENRTRMLQKNTRMPDDTNKCVMCYLTVFFDSDCTLDLSLLCNARSARRKHCLIVSSAHVQD